MILFAPIREFLRDSGYRVDLFVQTVLRLGSVAPRRRLIADQMVSLGLHVTHVVLLVGFVMGMIVSLQTGIELSRIGQQDQIGIIVYY